jgi:hypothetical protein
MIGPLPGVSLLLFVVVLVVFGVIGFFSGSVSRG